MAQALGRVEGGVMEMEMEMERGKSNIGKEVKRRDRRAPFTHYKSKYC
jgi:hypothetical protein